MIKTTVFLKEWTNEGKQIKTKGERKRKRDKQTETLFIDDLSILLSEKSSYCSNKKNQANDQKSIETI
jgi:hypothetical protein